jgi:prepilin-type N-terminal cleavage/methylation domain-containing protein
LKKAFSLIELLLTITLAGVMVILSFNYLNISTLSKQNTKIEFQSHLNIITATILQCKELSNMMPIQSGGSLASTTPLDTLECNTSIPYLLDGGKGSFIPEPLTGFTNYTATQLGTQFYFTTTTAFSSNNYEVLQELNSTYSTQQYELTNNGTTATLNFYLSH